MEMPNEVKKVYDKWYGKSRRQLLFFWRRDETFFVVTYLFDDKLVRGVRIFPIGDEYNISSDYSAYITKDS